MYFHKLEILIIISVFIKGCDSAVSLDDFYPFGSQTSDLTTPVVDDGGTGIIPIVTKFPLFNYQHDQLYVDNNGVISFLNPVSQYTPDSFPLGDGRRLIAPFWGDVDTSNGGTIWYRESTDHNVLYKATADVRRYFPNQIRFSAAWVFIATWDNVAFFGASTTGRNRRNTFQVILITNGRHSFTIFMYNRIEWTTGTASNGDTNTGLGGTPAQVGFNAGDGINFYSVEESRTPDIINIAHLTNVNETGVFAFRIDKEIIQNGGCNTGGTLVTTPRFRHMLGGEILVISGPCIKENAVIEVTCGNGLQLECARLSDFSLKCVTPKLTQIGEVHFILTLTSNEDGSINEYSGQFTSVDPSRLMPALRRVSPGSGDHNSYQTVTWDISDLSDFSVTKRHLLVAYIVKDGNGNLEFLHVLEPELDIREESYTFQLSTLSTDKPLILRLTSVTQRTRGIWSDVFFIRQSREAAEDNCYRWWQQESSLVKINSNFDPCPCDATQASLDAARFEEDPLCRLNSETGDFNCLYRQSAKQCFRLIKQSSSGAGRLCCYDFTESILNARDRTGGGTVHRDHYSRVGAVPYLSYFVQEMGPYLQCCQFSDRYCGFFFDARAPSSCAGYVPPIPSVGKGDPHIRTFDGQDYTFNGVGEFILMEDISGQMQVQVRAEQYVNDNGNYSRILYCLPVLPQKERRNMSDTVEVRLNSIRVVDVLINGVIVEMDGTEPDSTVPFNGGYTTFENIPDGSKVITVALTDVAVSLRIEAKNRMLNIMPSIGSKFFEGKMRGLLGNYDGDLSNDFLPRVGPMTPSNSSSTDIHYDFGMTWATTAEESLFTYPVGQNHGSYQNAAFVPILEAPQINNIPEHVQDVCMGNMDCLFDYAATESLDVAQSTRSFNAAFEVILISIAEVGVCDFPPSFNNGTWRTTGYRFGDNATFLCNGQTFESSKGYAVCDEHGTWNITEEAHCDEPRGTNTQHVY
ncbi:hypothetical protein ScPMuIL_008809 [Solemya velum]